jgi:hypothetical protein
LVTKTHHCLVDGMGSVDVGRILLDGERSPRRRRPAARWPVEHLDAEHTHRSQPYQHLLVKGAKAGR